MSANCQKHWSDVYSTKAEDAVSWYEPEPARSLDFISGAGLKPGASCIDVGAGTSRLADRLLDLGYEVTVLDISPEAIEAVRTRLHAAGHTTRVRFLAGDVTQIEFPPASFDLWHDRAVFHFLTEERQRDEYVARLQEALRPGGFALIATFNLEGPERCSGLDVMRYSPTSLHACLGDRFALLRSVNEEHVTPSGRTQAFQYSLFRKE